MISVFKTEALILIGFAFYALAWFVGKSVNYARAHAWWVQTRT